MYSSYLPTTTLLPNYRRANIQGGTYFFTVVTYRRQHILCGDNVRAALRTAIRHTQSTHPFTIDAWVLLPDHLHCIWTRSPDDTNFTTRWAMIKRFVTKACAGAFHREAWMTESRRRRNESTIWQRRFWEHLIRDEHDYEMHMNYLYYNPVKHGLVKQVSAWLYSTFHRYVRQGVFAEDWAGISDGQADGSYGEP